MRVRGTRGLPASHWVAALLALAAAGCGGEASAGGSTSQAAGMATASDLSDAEIVVYKSPT